MNNADANRWHKTNNPLYRNMRASLNGEDVVHTFEGVQRLIDRLPAWNRIRDELGLPVPATAKLAKQMVLDYQSTLPHEDA